MKPDRDKNFEQYLHQLLQLLKNIVKNMPQGGSSPQPFSYGKEVSSPGTPLNVFFFNFLPFSPEELDELEECLEEQLAAEDLPAEWSEDLNASDIEFLRDHGIRF